MITPINPNVLNKYKRRSFPQKVTQLGVNLWKKYIKRFINVILNILKRFISSLKSVINRMFWWF